VLHNFQVAQFRAKMDLVPGQMSFLWLTPTRTGKFEILCAELCGIGHFAMRGQVEVVEQDRFDAWLAEQPTYGELADRAPANAAAGAGLYALCTACHGAQGEGNPTLNAPRLAGLEAWYLERQLQQFKGGARGTHEADRFGAQMRPFAMALADDAAIANVSAHIAALPAGDPVATIDGDITRGARIYRTCGTCHGSAGQGIEATNAPRLAGHHDWYLMTQLQNFQQGIRGRHPEDLYGWQMAEMSRILIDEQGMRNVVAYINTLPTTAPPAGDALAGARD